MNRRQKIVGVLGLLFLLLLIFGRDAEGREVTIRGAKGTQTWDLTQMDQRVEFRALYGNDPKAGPCIARADYAVELMKRRDAGETEEDHLAEVRANYERTKSEPEGAVAYHVYVDFQRMVRDLHRRSGSDEWRYPTEGEVFEREVWWCVF